MALQADGTIRLAKRIGTTVWEFMRDVLRALFNIAQDDDAMTAAWKTAGFVVRRGFYFVLDYSAAALSFMIVVWIKEGGGSFEHAFFATWAYDFVIAGAFYLFYLLTGRDLSLGEDFRRAVDAARAKSRIAGTLSTLWVMAIAVFWAGPEKIVIFFRKELETHARTIATLIGLTSIQALFYTPAFWYGHNLYLLLTG